MSQSVHGHEVMEMMLAQGGQFTPASLKQAMAERFGAEARFHTCSASEMDAEALIDFLAARGKFIDSAEASRPAPTRSATTVNPAASASWRSLNSSPFAIFRPFSFPYSGRSPGVVWILFLPQSCCF